MDPFPEETPEEITEEFFLSILPLGMKRGLDIDGWVLQCTLYLYLLSFLQLLAYF
jgi:hypothetical protein